MRPLFIIPLVLFLTSCMSTGGDSPTTSTTPQTSTVVQSSSVSPKVTEKPDLSVVDPSTELHIERLCYDTKDDGVLPYWSCLTEELNKIKNISRPDLDVVDTSTELHIERLCYDTKDDGVLPYWSCLRQELKKIGVTPPEIPISTKQTVQSTPTISQDTQSVVEEPVVEEPVFTSKPDMSGLNEIDLLVIENHCESSKSWGIQDYWRCLHRQIQESQSVPFPDLVSVDKETRDIMITSCQFHFNWGIESFYGCLNDQLKSIGK